MPKILVQRLKPVDFIILKNKITMEQYARNRNFS